MGGLQNLPLYRLCGREGQDESRRGPLIWESASPEASNVGLNFAFNQCVLSNYKSSRMPTESSHLKEKHHRERATNSTWAVLKITVLWRGRVWGLMKKKYFWKKRRDFWNLQTHCKRLYSFDSRMVSWPMSFNLVKSTEWRNSLYRNISILSCCCSPVVNQSCAAGRVYNISQAHWLANGLQWIGQSNIQGKASLKPYPPEVYIGFCSLLTPCEGWYSPSQYHHRKL